MGEVNIEHGTRNKEQMKVKKLYSIVRYSLIQTDLRYIFYQFIRTELIMITHIAP